MHWQLLIKMAWRNIWRNQRRTLITAVALIIALVLMVLYTGLMKGMIRQMQHNVTHLTYGDFQIHHKDYPTDMSIHDTIPDWQGVVAKFNALGVKAAPRWYGYGLIANDRSQKSAGVQIQGLALNTEKEVTDLQAPKYMASGHFLSGKVEQITVERQANGFALDEEFDLFVEEDEVAEESTVVVEEIVLGKKVAELLGAQLGDSVVLVTSGSDGSIGNELFRVTGVLKNIGDTFDRTRVLIRRQAFGRLFSFSLDQAHEIALRRDGAVSDDQLVREAGEILPAGLLFRSWKKVVPLIADMLSMVTVSTAILTLIIYMAAAMVILNSILMMVFERFREFGVMKALGYKPFEIILLVMHETLFLTFFSVIIGSVLAAFGNIYLMQHGIDMTRFAPNGFDFSGTTVDPIMRSTFDLSIFLQPAGLLFVITLLSALYPAWKAARAMPIKAIYGRF